MEGEAAVKAQNTNSGFLKRVTALLANTAFIITLVLMAVLVFSSSRAALPAVPHHSRPSLVCGPERQHEPRL